MLARGVIPVIPSQGSVGASGDLAPLAQLAAAMLGVGDAELGGERMPAAAALARTGLTPLSLGPKEGLALLNGTQYSTAEALAACSRPSGCFGGAGHRRALDRRRAGSDTPFDARIQALRGHRGQIEVAAALRALMAGSAIRASHLVNDERVQDPYCLRCQPQVMGAVLDLMRRQPRRRSDRSERRLRQPADLRRHRRGALRRQLPRRAGGVRGRHAGAIAICEIGSLAERRIAMLIDPALSGLPAFLTPQPGLNSGFMVAQVTAAALVAENKQRAMPASVNSIPTSANQEDHVSMAAHGARRLAAMAANAAQRRRHRVSCGRARLRLPRADDVERAARAGARAAARARAATRPGPPPRARHRRRRRAGALRRTSPPPAGVEFAGAVEANGRMTEPRLDNARVIRAPRGLKLSAKSWQTEAPLRMLMNNLDPEVAEKPHELVVYGGIGRAARDWESFDRIVAALRGLEADETLLRAIGQAGRRVSHPCGRAAGADRELEPGAALGDVRSLQRARSQGPDDVRADDRGLVDLHRLAGHRAGHLRDLRRARAAPLRRQPRRQMDPDRRARRHGRRAAARRHHGGRVAAGDRVPALAHRDAAQDRLSRRAGERPRRGARDDGARRPRARSRSRSACSAMPPRWCPSWCGAA